METIERELVSLNRQLNSLEKDLKEKKKKYEASVQYLYKNKSIEEKLMFIFSAKNLDKLIVVCVMCVNMPPTSVCRERKY